MSPSDDENKGESLARQVQANVIAGLIVAAVVAVLGAIYSIAKSLSLYEFIVYVVLPAAALGIIASVTMLFLSMSNLFLELGARIVTLEHENDDTRNQLTAADDRLSRQVVQIVYQDVIAEAEREGWTVEYGDQGHLSFRHPEWGTAGTSGGDLDPERLRLLLKVGRGRIDKSSSSV